MTIRYSKHVTCEWNKYLMHYLYHIHVSMCAICTNQPSNSDGGIRLANQTANLANDPNPLIGTL